MYDANPFGGRQCPMWVLFGENRCENERIGSRWGLGVGGLGRPLDPPLLIVQNSDNMANYFHRLTIDFPGVWNKTEEYR